MRARLLGVKQHYAELHAWKSTTRSTEEMDYHLASVLFNMDSAIECCIFLLNALGWAASRPDFRDVSEDDGLANIRPGDVFGGVSKAGNPKTPLPGYLKVFPAVQKYWQKNSGLIGFIMEQHDVSKHRTATITSGGELRTDPPTGFFENLGIANDEFDRETFTPPMEILLDTGVKTPNTVRMAGRGVLTYRLEDAAVLFGSFIAKTGVLAEQNARKYIKLPVKRLRF